MTPSFSTMTPYDLVVFRVDFLSDLFTIIYLFWHKKSFWHKLSFAA